jgi:hypothetical protein
MNFDISFSFITEHCETVGDVQKLNAQIKSKEDKK